MSQIKPGEPAFFDRATYDIYIITQMGGNKELARETTHMQAIRKGAEVANEINKRVDVSRIDDSGVSKHLCTLNPSNKRKT